MPLPSTAKVLLTFTTNITSGGATLAVDFTCLDAHGQPIAGRHATGRMRELVGPIGDRPIPVEFQWVDGNASQGGIRLSGMILAFSRLPLPFTEQPTPFASTFDSTDLPPGAWATLVGRMMIVMMPEIGLASTAPVSICNRRFAWNGRWEYTVGLLLSKGTETYVASEDPEMRVGEDPNLDEE